MDIITLMNEMKLQAANIDPIGARLKFVLDEEHHIMIDGNQEENIVSNEDGDADCVISTSLENLIKLKKGELNPMMAVMSGKVKIKGDMGLAMKIQSLV